MRRQAPRRLCWDKKRRIPSQESKTGTIAQYFVLDKMMMGLESEACGNPNLPCAEEVKMDLVI